MDCGGGAIETALYGSYNAPVLFKDSRTGNLNIDENANPLNFVIWGNFGGGYCAGQVAGQVEFDDDNDVIIVSHNNSGSTIDLVSPAEITITFWY